MKHFFLPHFVLFGFLAEAQQTVYQPSKYLNTIITKVPFVIICPDARTVGMANTGVTNTGFYQSGGSYNNPALLGAGEPYLSFNASYVPWLRSLVPDINLFHISVAKGIKKRHAVGFDYTGFSLGKIAITDEAGNVTGFYKPYEQYVALRYSYRTLKGLSVGVSMKYIHSDITNGLSDTQPAQTIAGDLGLNYTHRSNINERFDLAYSTGFSITNVGNKVKYTDVDSVEGDFIPTNLSVGLMLTPRIKLMGDSTYLAFDVIYEVEKLLVPTPPQYMYNEGTGNIERMGYDPNVGVFEGMWQSFYDAPRGAEEEWNEVVHKVSIEGRLVYDNMAFVAYRMGYFHEDYSKGNRKYLTIGYGLGLMGINLNAAYLIPIESSLLENTFAVSLGYKCFIGKRFFRE